MALSDQAVQAAAARITAAWHANAILDPLPDDERPGDIDDAYRIQNALVEALGFEEIGYKVAIADPAAQAALGLTEPASGRMFARYSGTTPVTLELASCPGAKILLESEIAVRMGRTLAPGSGPHTAASVRDAVATVAPSFELAALRFESIASGGILSTIAANMGGYGAALGPEVALADASFATPAVTLSADGELIQENGSPDSLTAGLECLAWLANSLNARGLPLEEGALVLTGAICGPHVLEAGRTAVGDFGPLGSVTVALT